MADVVVTNDVDTFLRSADNAAARTNLEVYSDAEVDAKVATKATAGGGITDGNLGKIEILKDSNFEPTQDFSFSFDFKLITMPTSGTNSFLLINGTGSESVAIVFNVLNQFTFWFRDSSTNAIYGGTLSTANDLFGSWHSVALVSDTAAQTLTLYLDNKLYGVQNVSSINLSQITSGNSFYLGNGSSSALGANSAFKNFRHFNRALSAAEVAELYESGTVAVEDRWGTPTVLKTWDFSVGTDTAGTQGAGTLTGNEDGVDGVDDTLKYAFAGSSRHGIAFYNSDVLALGETYTLKFDYYVDGASTLVGKYLQAGFNFAANNLANTSPQIVGGSWQTATLTFIPDGTSYSLRAPLKATSSASPSLGLTTISNDIYFANVTVQRVGAIADLPLDEGIGYQFHDRSSNHFDALASTSGVTHLVPKQTGKVRVKAADASSAMYMLRADSILPTDSIISNVLSEQCYVDLTNSAQVLDDYRIRLNPSGSDLQIQRSDGSNHATLGTVTAPSSLSDVDVQIHYEQVAR